MAVDEDVDVDVDVALQRKIKASLFSFLFSLFSVEKNHLDWLRNLSKADLVGDNLDNVDLILAVGIHS